MRQAVQIIYDDGTVQVVGQDTQPSPPPPPPPPGPAILRGGYFDGVPVNLSGEYASLFSMSIVRMWYAVRDWTKPPTASDPIFARCAALKNQGLSTLVVFTPIEKSADRPAYPAAPDDNLTVRRYFDAAAQAATGLIDYWEVFNEPNLSQYNADYGALAKTVKNVLLPAYGGLKLRNQFVVGAPWSGATGQNFPYAIKNGYLEACDVVGYHPYGKDPLEQEQRVKTCKDLIGDKPLWITEWNLHGSWAGEQMWADMLVPAATAIKPYINAAIHFRLSYNTSLAGKAAPLKNVGTMNEERTIFYEPTRAAMRVFG